MTDQGKEKKTLKMSEIILAAKRGLYHRVLTELREGAAVDACDSEKATPLYWAACGGHSDICRLLLGKGANANLAVLWGSTSLHAAADRGHTDCIKYLLRYGAAVNVQNDKGDTPLHVASFRGHKDACIVLLTHSADSSILNNRGKTAHQEAQGAMHQDIAKILSEKKPAYRSASYPLTTVAGRDSAILKPRLRASDSDDALLRAQRKTSLRQDLLASSLDKQAESRERRPGIKPIHPPMNQLSEKPTNSIYHHHHRPFSDPTPAMLGEGRFNIDDLSDPAKLNNIMSDETDFHRKQEENERDHYLGAIDNLQLKVALLTSQKEALEVQLREGSGSPSQEVIRRELEQRLGAMMKELEMHREGKKAADARSRQLASELFQLKKLQPISDPFDDSSRDQCSYMDKSFGSEYHRLHQMKQGVKGSLTKSICSYLEKPHLCQDNSLHHVFSQLQEDNDVVQTLRASTNQRLHIIRSSLNAMKEGLLLDQAGIQWTLGTDYKVIDGRPVDRELKQSEDGLISQMCVRVQHKNQTYIMKVFMNHRRSPKPSAHQTLGDCMGAEFSILQSLDKASHPNITRIFHHFEMQTSELRNLFDISKFVDSTFYTQLADRTAMVVFPDYCTTLDHLLSFLGADSSKSSQPPNQIFILRLLLQLLKALSHLQDHGITHRDINSKAVVVDWSLRLVLGEFGYARSLQNDEGQGIPFVEKSQIAAGSPLAWSPELLQYSINGPPKSWQKVLTLLDVYESSDMYAVAAMLCNLFKSPAEETSPQSSPVMVAKCLPSLCFKPPVYLSSEAQALFGRLLRDNPAERPTLKEAILRTGMMLYGPRRSTVSSVQDIDAWMQAQDIRLLAAPPHSNTGELDELARSLDWELCYDYVHCVTPKELWQLCNEPLVG